MIPSGKVEYFLDPGVDISGRRLELLDVFLAYCCRALDLSHVYTGYFVVDRHANNLKTTGYCNYHERHFFVYCRGRAYVDILRTTAHELAHLRQYERSIYDENEIHFSSDSEDNANSLSGELVNAFAEMIGYDVIYEGKLENRKKAMGSRRDLG
jgi:hypothetical protein